jgi:phosphatidylglycerol---prolipoprotein diacylglyceryl transferase
MIPFLHVGPIAVPTFGLMVALAMVAAYFVLAADLARRGIADRKSGLAETFVAIPCLAGIVGAKLYHVFETPRDLFADRVGQIFSQFGFAWFGGLIAGIAAFLLIAWRRKIPLLVILDAGSPAAALGYGIGRIGCLLSGDGDYGVATSLPWGMSFPNGLVPTMERVHPTPIYEFIVACAIAWMLWRMGARRIQAGAAGRLPGGKSSAGKSSTGKSEQTATQTVTATRPAGEVFAAYMVLTGVARFLVEFIRINPRSFFGLTNAQAASVASVVLGAALWWKQHQNPHP